MLTYFCTTGGTSVSDKSLISSTSIVDENERSVKSDPKPPVHPLSEIDSKKKYHCERKFNI